MNDLQAKGLAVDIMRRHSPIFLLRQIVLEVRAIEKHAHQWFAGQGVVDTDMVTAWITHVTALTATSVGRLMPSDPRNDIGLAEVEALRITHLLVGRLVRLIGSLKKDVPKAQFPKLRDAQCGLKDRNGQLKYCREVLGDQFCRLLFDRRSSLTHADAQQEWKERVWQDIYSKADLRHGVLCFSYEADRSI
jgi:hypothetical protein